MYQHRARVFFFHLQADIHLSCLLLHIVNPDYNYVCNNSRPSVGINIHHHLLFSHYTNVVLNIYLLRKLYTTHHCFALSCLAYLY